MTNDTHGNTPLMQAAWRGDRAAVQAALAGGADPTAANDDGNNALWLACVADDAELVALLVRAGVPIDHQNLTGATCLMYAASSGKAGIVRALLALGADTRLASQDDYSALDMAANLECLQLLRAATRTPTSAPPSAPNSGRERRQDVELERYFLSYRGVRLPLTLVEELAPEALRNRNTYFRAGYDAAGRLSWVEKLVYGEVELRHDYRYGDGTLSSATICTPGEEPREISFPPSR